MAMVPELSDDTVFTSPPPMIQNALATVLAPLARLAGHQATYPIYSMTRSGKRTPNSPSEGSATSTRFAPFVQQEGFEGFASRTPVGDRDSDCMQHREEAPDRSVYRLYPEVWAVYSAASISSGTALVDAV